MEKTTIDAHAHYWPDNYVDHLKTSGSADTNIAKKMGAGNSETELKKRLKMMPVFNTSYFLQPHKRHNWEVQKKPIP
ncbi:MAG: hypothetical protein Q4A55_04425 [Aerococcus sp.]|nr:hypothetical protein [Aerococcus sp.]